MKKQLSPKQREELLSALKARFEKNLDRHKGVEWAKVQARLQADAEKLWSLSRQLRTLPSIRSGILCVGLAGAQDGAGVFANLSRRMRAGNLRGISAVVLLKRGAHVAAPKRTCIDLLEVRKNPSAERPLKQNVPLRPLGAALMLTPAEIPLNGSCPPFCHRFWNSD